MNWLLGPNPWLFYFDKDEGGGGGGGTSDEDGKNTETDKGKTPEYSAEQQEHINKLVGEARKEGRAAGKTEAENAIKAQQDADKTEAERKAAEDKGEFRALYQTTLTELGTAKETIKNLEAEINRLKGFEGELQTSLSDEIKGWPESVRVLDPGEGDLTKRREWANQMRPLAKQLKDAGTPANLEPGDKTPKGDGKRNAAATVTGKYKGPAGAK